MNSLLVITVITFGSWFHLVHGSDDPFLCRLAAFSDHPACSSPSESFVDTLPVNATLLRTVIDRCRAEVDAPRPERPLIALSWRDELRRWAEARAARCDISADGTSNTDDLFVPGKSWNIAITEDWSGSRQQDIDFIINWCNAKRNNFWSFGVGDTVAQQRLPEDRKQAAMAAARNYPRLVFRYAQGFGCARAQCFAEGRTVYRFVCVLSTDKPFVEGRHDQAPYQPLNDEFVSGAYTNSVPGFLSPTPSGPFEPYGVDERQPQPYDSVRVVGDERVVLRSDPMANKQHASPTNSSETIQGSIWLVLHVLVIQIASWC